MYTAVELQWDMNLQCGKHICLGAYVINMECMYTNTSGHIINCIEFI